MKVMYPHNTKYNTIHLANEYIGTVSSKGQITLPAPIRSLLQVKGQDKIAFAVTEGRVVLQLPSQLSLEDTFGAVTPINQPEDFQNLHDITIEEHIEHNRGV